MEEPFEINLWLAAAIVILSLVLSAFFAGAETAFTAASRARMLALENNGDVRAAIVNRLLGQRERFIGAMLIGNNIVAIGASSFTTSVLIGLFGREGVIYATIAMSLLVIVFAEVLPKTIAITSPDRMSLLIAKPVAWAVVAVRAADARRREARARHAAALRHPPRRASVRALGRPRKSAARSTSCTRRAASPRPSATCSAGSSTCATSPSPT